MVLWHDPLACSLYCVPNSGAGSEANSSGTEQYYAKIHSNHVNVKLIIQTYGSTIWINTANLPVLLRVLADI